MNRKYLTRASALGWILSLFVAGAVVAGVSFADLAGFGGKGASAADAPKPQRLTTDKAVAIAATWADGYVQDTIGRNQRVDGRSMSLADMQLVDARFVPGAREIVTSVTTAVSLPSSENVWVISWERSGVHNVTTGQPDGTAFLVLVMEDGAGKVRDAAAGVRQPEEQARKAGPLPSFGSLLGNAIKGIEEARARCGVVAHGSDASFQALRCE